MGDPDLIRRVSFWFDFFPGPTSADRSVDDYVVPEFRGRAFFWIFDRISWAFATRSRSA